jgi:CheY-like chemotaxis protein
MSHAEDGAPESNPRPKCVLLVDDNFAERSALSQLFELRGFAVTAVPDGAAALAVIEHGEPFDILLTDLRLPDADGREIALRVSQTEPRPLVALMTGWDPDPEDGERYGIDLVFIKPLDSADVVSRIRAKLSSPLNA